MTIALIIMKRKVNIKESKEPLSDLKVYLLIITVCSGLYFNSVSYDISNNDDDVMIRNKIAFIKDPGNIPEAFITDAWYSKQVIELYRPLQTISFILDAQRGNDITFQAHLTNLILHILCCITIFFLLLALKINRKIALFGALVYATHFLFLHTVIWIPARGDLLLALFSLLSFLFFIRLTETGHWKDYVGHLFCIGLALFSKETASMLPLIFMCYVILISGKSIFRPVNYLLAGFYLVIFTVYYFLRKSAISESGGALGLTGFIRDLPTIPETVAKFLIPVNFSTMPAYQTSATIIGSIVILGALFYFIFKRDHFSRLTLFSIIWFLLLIIPGMMYRPDFASYTYEYLDHRSYLVCFGLLVMVLKTAQDYKVERHSKFWIASIAILIYLATLNLYLSRAYRNPLAYAEQAIRSNPKSALAYFIKGNELFKQGDTAEALYNFSQATALHPDYKEARLNRALILIQEKKYSEALTDLDHMISNEPGVNAPAYNARGIVKANLNDLVAAFNDFEMAVKLDPNLSEATRNLEVSRRSLATEYNSKGIATAQLGDYQSAMLLFNKAIETDPKFNQAVINLGNCKYAMGDVSGACDLWRSAAKKGERAAQEKVDKLCK